ncbi:U-scoloptoxin(05)-Cw1a-like [Uloborus diversus]|uniref:U-scoloptoxin(05)-Cw1a-like n=1 Tax=Uloborus diversus TaxID=327109 RepID=UPI00240A5D79|nr:U-scoloptoxin(05)-Cw1a-like [Uloborus diversus]
MRKLVAMTHTYALVFSVIMHNIMKGEAISCYTCSSRNGTDLNCHDPFHPAMSTYTEGCKVPKEGHIGQFPANFCIKVIGKTEMEEEHVIRACTLENMDNQCGVFRFEKDTLQGCILTCDYDGCNSQNRLLANSFFLSMILTALFLTFG